MTLCHGGIFRSASPPRFLPFIVVATMDSLTSGLTDYGQHAADIRGGSPMQPSSHRVTCQYTGQEGQVDCPQHNATNRESFVHIGRIYERQDSNVASTKEESYQNFHAAIIKQPINNRQQYYRCLPAELFRVMNPFDIAKLRAGTISRNYWQIVAAIHDS